MRTMGRRAGRRARCAAAAGVAVLLLAGCGGGDDGGGDADAAAEPVEATAGGEAEPRAGGAGGGPSGTIVVDGTAHEVRGSQREFRVVDGKAQMIEAGGDFGSCTTSDGGEEGKVAAIVDVDGAELAVFLGSDGTGGYAAYSPVQGQHADPYEATFDGARVSGTADFTSDGGPLIEFDLTCG